MSRCLKKDFDYVDIQKRSMLSDPKAYRSLVSRIAVSLSLPVAPSLEAIIKIYGGDRFKDKVEAMTEEYKVFASSGDHT